MSDNVIPPPPSQPPPPGPSSPPPPQGQAPGRPWWKRKWVIALGAFLALGVVGNLTTPPEDDAATSSEDTTTTLAAADPTPTPHPTTAPEPTTPPVAAAVPEPTATPLPTATPVPTARPLPTATPEPVELSEETNDMIAALAIRITIEDNDPLLALILEAQSDEELVDFADSVCDVAGESNTSEELLAYLLIANNDAMEFEQVAMLAGSSMGARCQDELTRLGLG